MSTGWDMAGKRTGYCDERMVGEAEGAAVGYSCGRALAPGNTSGKCEDHTPKAELRVEGSHAGAAHVAAPAETCCDWTPDIARGPGWGKPCGNELPCFTHRRGFGSPPPTPLIAARQAYEAAEREVARLKRVLDALKAQTEAAAKDVTVAAHKAHELSNRYVEILRA